MQPSLRLRCSRCGVESSFSFLDAGQRRYCSDCRAPIFVPPLGKPVTPRTRTAAHPPNDSCLRIWAVGAVAALVLAPGIWWLNLRHERARDADSANKQVVAKVADARACLARERWDEAAALLQSALAIENATHLEVAQALWNDLRGQQAAGVLRTAEAALARRDVAQTLSLLQSYLEDPYGAEHEKARSLKAQLELATSDEEAAARLHQLTDEALIEFAGKGTLRDTQEFSTPDAYAIYLEKLRSGLETEFRRREEARADRARRIQATPVFSEFQELVTLSRRRLQARTGGGKIDQRLLARFFAEVQINGAEEQQRIRNELGKRQPDFDEAERLARIRANFKERLRAYKEFDDGDRELFDRTVDHEMNQLLQDLQ
jgi:hypothetical protein